MMAEKKTFPMLPIAHWSSLRKKFQQSIPGVVTDTYIATVLNMEAKSARANVLPYLRILGIINDDLKTTARAKAWRDDDLYPTVCVEMLGEIYPEELIHAVPDATNNRTAAERWFANHTGTGTAAVKRMTALYAAYFGFIAKPNSVSPAPTITY